MTLTRTEVVSPVKIAPRKGIESFSFDDGLVLLDGRANRLFAYNDSAAAVWHALSNGADGAHALRDAYGIPREQAEQDAAAILEHWQSLGLLSGSSRPGAVSAGNTDPAPLKSQGTSGGLRATYRIGERSFRIAVSEDDVAKRVEAVFRSFRVESDTADECIDVCRTADGRDFILNHDGSAIYRLNSVAEVTGALFQTVLGGVHSGARWLAIIHGGAVAIGGRAVLLPGSSGSGKSTLGAFLVSRGFDFLCDDMLAVTQEGRVANWPIPISIKEGSWKALAPYLPQLEAIPAEFVWGRTMKFLPVASSSAKLHANRAAVFIFPKFDPMAASPRMMRLRPIEALQRLISDRIWLGYPLRAKAVEGFLPWLAQIPSYALSYGNFDSVERLVRETALRD